MYSFDFSLDTKEKKFLLRLARDSINYYLKNKKIMDFEKNKLVSKKLAEKKASFVTLAEDGELRGCVGNLEAREPLYLDIIKNAVNSAFYDSRFSGLSKEEFNNIKIEISVLTKPIKIDYSSASDLLEKISKEDGLIINYMNYRATFLPQVWKDIDSKESFLFHLCSKAGLDSEFWKTGKLEVFKYRVICFSES